MDLRSMVDPWGIHGGLEPDSIFSLMKA